MILENRFIKDILLNQIIGSYFIKDSMRARLYNVLGLKVDTNRVRAKIFMGGKDVSIGENTFVNYGCVFNSVGGIQIGKNCDIASEVMFVSSTHLIGSMEKRAGQNYGEQIIVEDGCWIGTRAIILQGVRIGKGTIIAAGAVVTKNCDKNSIYAGCPAIKIKSLN